MKERNWDAWQVSAGFIFALCLGLYLGVPSVQRFVDGTWAKSKVRWYELRDDFRGFYSLSSGEKVAIERTRIKKACKEGDTKACQYLQLDGKGEHR